MMVLVESKQATSKSSVLNTAPKDEKSSLSFSELLKGADKKGTKAFEGKGEVLALEGKGVVLALGSEEKDLKLNTKVPLKAESKVLKLAGDEKEIIAKTVMKDDALVLALGNEKTEIVKVPKISEKRDALISLLKGKETSVSELKDALVTKTKSTHEVVSREFKTLILDAKDYLKSKLAKGDEYNKTEIKEIKHTLKGVTTLAQKIGVDIVKASIEEVKVSKTNNPKSLELKSTPLRDAIETPTQDTKVAKSNVNHINNPKSIEDNNSNLTKVIDKLETYKTKIQEEESKDKNVVVNKQIDPIKTATVTNSKVSPDHTTEQIVTTKQLKVEIKTPKEKADETLKQLLRGEKAMDVNSKLTPDFSVATAKVIAPTATTDATKNLEKLLHGESSSSENQSNSSTKVEASTSLKTDSFEVKLNEAKQMIKYISQDVKNVIEDYKSPFTRVKVQLNPQRLGEIDLTIVQRGKNLHVSISSNNTAINALSMNANELRTQLSSNGINNATLNFNDSSQNNNSNSAGQQQNRQNERKANEEYNYFDETEANEEILSSLEIVVANYA
ncbi:flagellar hook-length control protein FliK [Sulfurimonas sp.]|uniref:flagellar hook-length control protein FliK n=1 Tax=Sulfurimonas sp. TaxID=2022749 RepID=UPI0025FF0EAE|nr:flagellar hook-length control protein FliK [Sulfurimonas sp.]